MTLSLSLVCLMQSIDFGRMSLQLSRLRGVNTSLLTELNNMKAHLQKLGPAQPQLIRVSRRQLTPLSHGELEKRGRTQQISPGS